MEIVIVVLIAAVGIGAALLPLVRRGGSDADGPVEPHDEVRLSDEIDAYRAALKAGTVCERCGRANQPGSRYCIECGARLAGEKAERAG